MSKSLTGKRIALVGGASFIGHNLALKLNAKGANVAVIDGLHINNLLSFHCSNGTAGNRELYSQFIAQRMQLLRDADIPLFVQDARAAGVAVWPPATGAVRADSRAPGNTVGSTAAARRRVYSADDGTSGPEIGPLLAMIGGKRYAAVVPWKLRLPSGQPEGLALSPSGTFRLSRLGYPAGPYTRILPLPYRDSACPAIRHACLFWRSSG